MAFNTMKDALRRAEEKERLAKSNFKKAEAKKSGKVKLVKKPTINIMATGSISFNRIYGHLVSKAPSFIEILFDHENKKIAFRPSVGVDEGGFKLSKSSGRFGFQYRCSGTSALRSFGIDYKRLRCAISQIHEVDGMIIGNINI